MYDSDPMTAISLMGPHGAAFACENGARHAIERLAAASARIEEAQSAVLGWRGRRPR
jgi:hypothetical protein